MVYTIKLIFDMHSYGKREVEVDVPFSITEVGIRKLFPRYIGVDFDENCSYEIVGCS